MFNLINAELYKLRKGKSFFVCCIIVIAFTLFTYGCLVVADMTQKGSIDLETASSMGVHVEVQEGSAVEEGQTILETMGIMDMEQMLLSTFLGIIIAVFVSIFVIGDYGNGAIKNVAGKGFTRMQIFLAKYMATVVAVFSMMIISAIVVFLGGLVVFNTDGPEVKDLLIYVGLQSLLHVSLAGIMIMICDITRNLGICISINVGIYMFSGMLTAGLDLVLHKWDVSASDYWITDLIGNCPIAGFENEFLIRAVAVAIAWAVIAFLVGNLHFKKADIK